MIVSQMVSRSLPPLSVRRFRSTPLPLLFPLSPLLPTRCVLFFTPRAAEGCARDLSPLSPRASTLFFAIEPSQPLSHQPLPHSFPFNGGGRVVGLLTEGFKMF